jgi:hypothetical protein
MAQTSLRAGRLDIALEAEQSGTVLPVVPNAAREPEGLGRIVADRTQA